MRTEKTVKENLTAIANEKKLVCELQKEEQVNINAGGRDPKHQSLWEKWLNLLAL